MSSFATHYLNISVLSSLPLSYKLYIDKFWKEYVTFQCIQERTFSTREGVGFLSSVMDRSEEGDGKGGQCSLFLETWGKTGVWGLERVASEFPYCTCTPAASHWACLQSPQSTEASSFQAGFLAGSPGPQGWKLLGPPDALSLSEQLSGLIRCAGNNSSR